MKVGLRKEFRNATGRGELKYPENYIFQVQTGLIAAENPKHCPG